MWKFGWGIAYLDPQLAAKLDLLARHRVLASPGGTLLEIAWAQGRTSEFLDWAADAGFPCVEVSAGTVPMEDAAKRDLIAAAAERFIVLAEVGSKHAAVRLTPEQWAQAAAGDLEAGATWILAEGRASGTVGIYEPFRSDPPGRGRSPGRGGRPGLRGVRGAPRGPAGLVRPPVRPGREPGQRARRTARSGSRRSGCRCAPTPTGRGRRAR